MIFTVLLSPVSLVAGDRDDVMGDGFGESFKYRGKQWKEASRKIPALPKDENLLFFKVYNARFKHYVDSKSLDFGGGDNIARYTVVVVAPSGTRNIMFEGIRCDTQQYKTYAYSINGAPFQVMQGPQWYKINPEGTHAFRMDLFKHYLCENSIIRGKEKDVIALFKASPENNSDDEGD